MWYLEFKTLALISIFTCFMLGLRLFKSKKIITIRKYALLLFAIFFIGFFSKRLLAFYLLFIASNYLIFQAIFKFKKYNKIIFISSIAYNILIVSIFRFAVAGDLNIPFFNTVLMIGLSYSILRMINLLYNAYFIEEQISIIDFCNYMLFIPSFTAGPIMLYQDFKQEIERDPSAEYISTEISTKRIIIGFFKKIVVAALMLQAYNYLLGGELNFYKSFLILFIYYIMGYFDFSGYSDIAVGFGGLMGIKVTENFKKPFSSPSLTQFWRNWHITLGNWARMHIYIPLSKKDGTMTRLQSGMISIVIFAFIGLWHGYNLSFFMWGMYHGIVIFFENIFEITTVNKKKVNPVYFWFRCGLTNVLVAFGEIFLISANPEYMHKILLGFLKF